MENLEQIIWKEKEIHDNLKIECLHRTIFATAAYMSLNYFLDGRYDASAIMFGSLGLSAMCLVLLRKTILKDTPESYVPIPSVTIPVGITLGCYALNELYNSLLNGPLLNP